MNPTTNATKTAVVIFVVHPFFQLCQVVRSDGQLDVEAFLGHVLPPLDGASHGEVVFVARACQ